MPDLVTKSGVLVLSAWIDGEDPRSVRARFLTASATADGEQRATWAAAGLDEVVHHVRRWLENLAAPVPTGHDDATKS